MWFQYAHSIADENVIMMEASGYKKKKFLPKRVVKEHEIYSNNEFDNK